MARLKVDKKIVLTTTLLVLGALAMGVLIGVWIV